MSPEDPNLIERYHNDGIASTTGNPTIIAMGVGGGGCNAVAYMHSQGVKGVDFVVLNTDRQALDALPVESKVLLGPNLCGGLGAGGRPEVGREAAIESEKDIARLLTPNVKMVFVTAGMGGGTGTGGAPVVAAVAKKMGILTVGIVTIPFFFEGMNKITSAIDGAMRLQENVDALLVINNDRLGDIYPDMEWSEAFTKADDVLAIAARTISDMVTNLANINIDMRDVDTCLRDGRTAIISVGYGEATPDSSETRMSQAIRTALHSPLLCDTNINTSKELLFAFYYSHNINPPFKVTEAIEANNLVREINKDVHIKFGWGYDDSLGDKIKFTILASGFDVSVNAGGGKHTISGGPVTDETPLDERIANAYGKEKVDDFTRRQETQNYIVLSADQIDDDAAIEMLESSPAYKRNKRKAARTTAPEPEKTAKPAETPRLSPQDDPRDPDQIFFSSNDR